MELQTVAFFGISGAGKGTQATLLEKSLKDKDSDHGIIRPEMGNLLRNFMKSASPFADKIGQIVTNGGLVPSFMPIHLLIKMLEEKFDGMQHLILDGTCRRPDQSRALNDVARMWGREKLDVIVLALSKETAKKRLISRGRMDDAKDEVIQSRFAWYQEQVVPAIDELKNLGWKIHEIDGELDIETGHKKILSVLGL